MQPLAPSSVEVSGDRRRLVVSWPGGRETTAPAAWLFDNAEGGFDPKSGHRLHGALALAGAMELDGAEIEAGAIVVRFAPGGEMRSIPLSALARAEPAPGSRAPRLWPTADEVAAAPPIPFEACLADDQALRDVLDRVVRRGIAFLAGARTEPGPVEQLVARFGYVRETNYGRLFDVREEIAATHLAYTPVGLDLHTDNPYREPVPTLQVLHVIGAAAEGGENQFADGFAHAAALRAAEPARFDVLAATAVEFAYAGPSGERYAACAPIIETSAAGEVVGVRLNHRSLRSPPPQAAEPWYEAYLDFYSRVHAPAARLARKLAPGDMVIFDNRRVLHGRSPYRGGAVRRWLQGCYADIDGLKATLSRLPATDERGGE
jgi:[2-(trimethylamino)ethyl]phosphonate dioxygenase